MVRSHGLSSLNMALASGGVRTWLFQYAEVGTGESLYRRGSVAIVLLPVGKSRNPEDDQVIDGFPLYKQHPLKKCGSELHHRYTDLKKASIVSEVRKIQSRRDEVILA